MENFMSNNIEEIHEYSIVGQDLTTLIIQPGFVEGVVKDERSFKSIEKAFQYIFRNNKEYCIVLWNGIPFKMNYTEDIPKLIIPLVKMLKLCFSKNKNDVERIDFKSDQIDFSLQFSFSTDQIIAIKGDFNKVYGDHQHVLNTLGLVRISVKDFLSEWKLLIEQLIQAFDDSNIRLSNKSDREIINEVMELNSLIPFRAIRYRYDER